MRRVVRFGPGALAELGGVLAEIEVERALLLTTARGARSVTPLPVVGTYAGVRPHVPIETVYEAARAAEDAHADGLVALGGGSAVDTAKATAAELATRGVTPPRVVAVPTTYAGAEWTPFFGVVREQGRKRGGVDERARPVAAIYDPVLTLDLPRSDTVGTAMNALAHCAEAYYHPSASEEASREADAGAAAISGSLPLVVAELRALPARTRLLDGAMHASLALAGSGLCLGHALAQALGGRYGLAHGAMNAICLPAALRFNADVVPESVARFGRALGSDDAAARCEELARLGGFKRLRELGVPADELAAVAEDVVGRPGAQANPRPASAVEVALLLRSIW